MSQVLQSLRQLNTLDKEILLLRQARQTEPEALKKHQQELRAAQEAAKQGEKRVQDVKSQADKMELELKGNEAEILRLRGQLATTKNMDNKQYKVFLSEIDGKVNDNSVFEDKILLLMSQVDELNEQLKQLRRQAAGREAEVAKEAERVNADIKEIDEKLVGLEARRAEMIKAVDPDALARYERVLRQRGLTAVAEVRSQTCQGCFTKITLQVYANIAKDSEIVFCRSCGRVLYLPDEEKANFQATASRQHAEETEDPLL